MNSYEAKHRQQIVEWKDRIVACRGSGMSVKAWCQQEGYPSSTYYRWERELLSLAGEPKTEAIQQVQAGSMAPVFEELPAAMTQLQTDTPHIIASVRVGKSCIEVYQGASADIVAAIFKGLGHAK